MNNVPETENQRDSFNLDDIFTKSIDMNSLNKTDMSSKTIQKYFLKTLKLRNVTKKVCWNRTSSSSNIVLLKIADLFPKVKTTQIISSSIFDYISNEKNEMILADLFKSSNEMDFYDSIDCNSVNKNSLLIANLIYNKDEKRDKIVQLLEKTYDKIKISSKNTFSSADNIPIYNFYIFNKEESLKNTLGTQKKKGNYICKYYTIFPNVNFELRQIKNLTFSNTNLNRFLVGKQTDEFKENENCFKDGFFTMSQNHRLIALKNDIMEKGGIKNSQTLKQILFGTWMNFKDVNLSHRKIDIEGFILKNKQLIYQNCLSFIQLSSKAEAIFSPSPDQSIFLLVLFFKDMQCHFEVKLIPNEEDKIPNFEELMSTENGEILSKYGPSWLISKSKIGLNANNEINIDLDSILNESKIYTLSEYYEKKAGLNKSNILTKSSNTNKGPNTKNSMNFNFQDNLIDIFDTSDLDLSNSNDLYNFPLIMPQKPVPNSKSQINPKSPKEKNFEEPGSCLKKNFFESCHTPKKNKNIYEVSSASATTTNTENNLRQVILEQGKVINQLQSQVSKLEVNIKSVLDELMANNEEEEEEEENEDSANEDENNVYEIQNEYKENLKRKSSSKKVEKDNIQNIIKRNKSNEMKTVKENIGDIYTLRGDNKIYEELQQHIEKNTNNIIDNKEDIKEDNKDEDLTQSKSQLDLRKHSVEKSVLVPKIVYQESLLNQSEDDLL